jgi:ketosteroid isomerase-like protein
VVFSPLYGERKAVEFYQELFKDTASSKITLLRVFESGTTGAVLFRYDWVLKNGTSTFFECVDILEFSQGKIQSLKIIYDTSHVHILLNTSKPSTVEGTAGEVAA